MRYTKPIRKPSTGCNADMKVGQHATLSRYGAVLCDTCWATERRRVGATVDGFLTAPARCGHFSVRLQHPAPFHRANPNGGTMCGVSGPVLGHMGHLSPPESVCEDCEKEFDYQNDPGRIE